MAGAWWGAGASVGIALLAGWRDARRTQRANLDRVGWADWRALEFAALLAAFLLLSFGLNGR